MTSQDAAKRAWQLVPAIIAADPKLIAMPSSLSAKAVQMAIELDAAIQKRCSSLTQVEYLQRVIAGQKEELVNLRASSQGIG